VAAVAVVGASGTGRMLGSLGDLVDAHHLCQPWGISGKSSNIGGYAHVSPSKQPQGQC